MLVKTADRFAQTSLALYGREGTFATSVDSEEDMELIAQAFERLGCLVLCEPLRRQVRVTASMRAEGVGSRG